MACWVVPRRQQVEHLTLDIEHLPHQDGDEWAGLDLDEIDLFREEPVGFSRVTALLGTLCCGALTSLDFRLGAISDGSCVGDWLLPLPQLRRLALSSAPLTYLWENATKPPRPCTFSQDFGRRLSALTYLELRSFNGLSLGRLPAGLQELKLKYCTPSWEDGEEMVGLLAAAAGDVTGLQALTIKHSADFENEDAGEPPDLGRLPASLQRTLTRLVLGSSASVELPLLGPLGAVARLQDLSLGFYQGNEAFEDVLAAEFLEECLQDLSGLTQLTALSLGCGLYTIPEVLDPLWSSPGLQVRALA